MEQMSQIDASQKATKMAKNTNSSGNDITSRDAIEKIKAFIEKMADFFSLSNSPKHQAWSREGREALHAIDIHQTLWLSKPAKITPIEERMLALEKVVRKSLKEPASQVVSEMGPQMGVRPTYAAVAAPPVNKTTVRIRIPGSEDMAPTQLLSLAKEHIQGAYAVRQLRSQDTEVLVHSTSQRDVALNMPHPKAFKILRQDFPVEISGVPLETKVMNGKNADNSELIRSIIEATKGRIPGLNINRMRWLHDGKEYERSKKNGHTRGTIIMSLPSEELQAEVVRKGIVLNAMLYSAQLWSPNAQSKQCFNCSQWGHTQAVCRKAVKCGQCAGNHQSRNCPKKEVLCCNYGKEHQSWHKKACPTFQTYKKIVENNRIALMERTAEIRKERNQVAEFPRLPTVNVEAEPSTMEKQKTTVKKRGPGRPRKESLTIIPMTDPFEETGTLSQAPRRSQRASVGPDPATGSGAQRL